LADALAAAGRDDTLRSEVLEGLREGERASHEPMEFRELVRWPLVLALLRDVGAHPVVLDGGLVIEVSPSSRIEKALLLSHSQRPDHVWEPQTTKLLLALGEGVSNVIVGGAYIGDQVLPLARHLGEAGTVHAFEPMSDAFRRLVRNVEINELKNVVTQRKALWGTTGRRIGLEGSLALASSRELTSETEDLEWAESITIDDYSASHDLASVGLIMLDTEGGELCALEGARDLLGRPSGQAPNVVFEINRNFVDWSGGLEQTPIAQMLIRSGFVLYAIRDFHDNVSMEGYPIEVVPIESVYLEGPPHGFNMMATKDGGLISRLGIEIVDGVSPKLLAGGDPVLHGPRNRPERRRDSCAQGAPDSPR
jgi:FkbM family methyltransferase